mmetsp:Transcript_36909/g.71200  ORF Transcript_36909/g.71200 Transcript_36909/m.71200 type:complete len:239 (-) Transcript_36909:2832-3548(-)
MSSIVIRFSSKFFLKVSVTWEYSMLRVRMTVDRVGSTSTSTVGACDGTTVGTVVGEFVLSEATGAAVGTVVVALTVGAVIGDVAGATLGATVPDADVGAAVRDAAPAMTHTWPGLTETAPVLSRVKPMVVDDGDVEKPETTPWLIPIGPLVSAVSASPVTSATSTSVRTGTNGHQRRSASPLAPWPAPAYSHCVAPARTATKLPWSVTPGADPGISEKRGSCDTGVREKRIMTSAPAG